MPRDCPRFSNQEKATPEAGTAQAHVLESQKSQETKKKKGKKYISFYGLCTTQLLWPASLWVGSPGKDPGALRSLHEAGAPCAPVAETEGEEIKVTKQASQV